MAIRLDGSNSGHGHPLGHACCSTSGMNIHNHGSQVMPWHTAYTLSNARRRGSLEGCLGTETQDNRARGKTATGKLTSSIGFFPVIFVLRRVLFLWQSGNGTLPSLSWRLHRSGLRRCTWGGRGLLLQRRHGEFAQTRQLLHGELPSSRWGRTVHGARCGCRPNNPLLHEGVSILTSLRCFAVAACTAFAAAVVTARVAFMFMLRSISSVLGLGRSARRSSTAVAWPAASAGA